MNNTNIDYDKFDSGSFLSAEPYPLLVVDNFLHQEFANKLEEKYPGREDTTWWSYNNHFEKKLACNNINSLDSCFRDFFNLVNSRKFVSELEKLTGIPGLIADPSLHGGGLHRIERGGKLDVHADFNYHKITGWRRRLNLIVYLNKDWKEEYNGQLELWDTDLTHAVKSVYPAFNRIVIFNTQPDGDTIAYHGHPIPLESPEGVNRKSIALYYYTKEKPNNILSDKHKTIYKKV